MDATFTLLAAGAAGLLSLTCADATPASASSPICYASADGRSVQSTFRVTRESAGIERLEGVTEFRTHGLVRVVELASVDATGRLLRLEATVDGPGEAKVRVVLDAPHGHVDITSPWAHIEWSVPTDLPWVFAPLATAPKGGPMTTPVDSRVILRAAASGSAVRVLDLGILKSHTIAADQLVSPDDDGKATVVMANDYIEMQNGFPSELHLAALGIALEATAWQRPALTVATASAGCAPSARLAP